MRVKNLKSDIEYCLKNIEQTRNSDISLLLNIWNIFYPEHIIVFKGEKYIRMKALYYIPREDSVKRERCYFQNKKHQYLPTSDFVIKKRRIKEEVERISH